jgi:cell wall-associated NlpC family hydrolase
MWADKYVGIPFAENGRHPRGFDCWGLVRSVLFYEVGLQLPAFDTVDSRDVKTVGHEIRRQRSSQEWQRIPRGKEQAFDVAVMWTLLKSRSDSWERMEVHVGLVVGKGRLLHTEPKTGSVCVPFTHDSVRDRITRIYRNRSLA